MPINDGFKDSRTNAELLLAPAKPAGRTLMNSNSLKLNLGGDAAPGSISNPNQITGAVRNSFKNALSFKTLVNELSKNLAGVLSNFDAVQKQFQTGNLVQKDPLFANTSSTPSASDFFSFSTLAPGQPVPQSFKAQLLQRQKQLQSLAKNIATAFNNLSFSGVSIQENTNRVPNPQPEEVDNPSIPKLAQGGSAGLSDPVYQDKNKFVVRGVDVATGKPGFWQRLLSPAHAAAQPTINTVVNQNFKDTTNKGTWSEPPSPYAAQFPYNKVQQSESGHVIEVDDTPGAERIHIFHRSGSFIEWHPDGTVVYKNMKNAYSLTMADHFVKVSGNCHIAVDGDATLYSKGEVHVQSDKDVSIQTKGDFNVYADNINLRAKNKFLGDGTLIDLRYIKLPGSIFPYFAGLSPSGFFGPKIDLAALAADYPSFSLASAGGAPDPTKVVPQGFTSTPQSFTPPPQSPLGNPSIYATKTPEAVSYRAKLFDTPEEVGNFEHYTSHLDLQKTLGDYNTDPKNLGGNLNKANTNITTNNKPTVNLLNFDDYKGNFNYSANQQIANTTFHYGDLVDTIIHPNVMAGDMSTPLPPPTPLDATGASPTQGELDVANQIPDSWKTDSAYWGS